MDLRPADAVPMGGAREKKIPDGFHTGGGTPPVGPKVPGASDNPTVVVSGNNSPTAQLDPLTRHPDATRPFVQAASQETVLFTVTTNHQTVGWVAIVGGKGFGSVFPLTAKQCDIGRGETSRVRIAFGDDEISRTNHCAILYDEFSRSFNIVRGTGAGVTHVNRQLLLESRPLQAGDIIRVGKTYLRFFPMCGPDFSWEDAQLSDATYMRPPAAAAE